MDKLERAIEIAVKAHAGQLDKGGTQYILHPLRVMLKMATEDERVVAVLHDVVEDSNWTLSQLAAEGFPPAIINALDNLTRKPGEDYEFFIQRASTNPLSARVKLADLEDNSDCSRLRVLTDSDYQRLAKYTRAIRQLRDSLKRQSQTC
jgi:hypothetical protein